MKKKPLSDNELIDWLRLMHTRGVGDITAHSLLKAFGLPQQIFNASYSALIRVVSEGVAQALLEPPSEALNLLVEKTLAWHEQEGNAIVTLSCPEYPATLLETSDPPTILYAKGRFELLNSPVNLAVVGSRSASKQGINNAELFAKELTLNGLTIVSGLALGIDAAAHRGALDAKHNSASTIAVIGTGCDIVYPARNRELAHRIAADGLIISEFPIGTKALANHFPRRNRIISGLAQGVLVVEAALQSGSLITARQALEQNREVFAIPGSIHSPIARGCHLLIRQGAKLVESAQDVLEELHFPTLLTPSVSMNSEYDTIKSLGATSQLILEQLGFDPCNTDELASRTELSIAVLSAELMLLELSGLIEKHPGNIYSRCA